eukprot:JZ554338.1.p3 GENE.JZ554338.1~~JZ554338.1.p3  ORF type:complete len:52 (-),score=2.25 JZ554338.1:151-306(-)
MEERGMAYMGSGGMAWKTECECIGRVIDSGIGQLLAHIQACLRGLPMAKSA